MNKDLKIILLMMASVGVFTGCNQTAKTGDGEAKNAVEMKQAVLPQVEGFNRQVDGKETKLFVLKNANGSQAAITNYGGRIVSLMVKNNQDQLVDVVLGHDSLAGYQTKDESFYGALVGRYANRIAKGKFTLDNKEYNLQVNDGQNTLHGGVDGFYDKVWDAKQVNDHTLELSYLAKDGEAGYPGNLNVKVVYDLTAANELKISYHATTDKPTVLNLTNHAYFNLSGAGDTIITDHMLTIHAAAYTPVDATLIPTGKLEPVSGTPFDFNKPMLIGARINEDHEQLKRGGGYDHNFVLSDAKGLRLAATLHSPKSGIYMDVLTEEPGVQFYSGNFMTGKTADGKGGQRYGYRSAICLETQHFPDSPNQKNFPSTVLRPGQDYKSVTVYKFYTAK
ncbi:aldose 1-epimerase [Pedobacter sp. CAN_A7]|uniref:aldose epimerase family protein n=1 Tax=Pedobacter sp. CAN_A7 TaxID=2787722 RepID=UPI001A2224B0